MGEEGALVMEGGVSAAIVVFLQTAVLRMIPYAVPAVFLIALDLFYGIRAAKYRGEEEKFSPALRRTITQLFSYGCWIILASTLALSFKHDWLEWAVLGLVYVNEFVSIVGNYLETKGITFSFVGFYRWVLKLVAGKAGGVMDDFEAGDIIKPKDGKGPGRDKKSGRFVSPRPRE